MAGNSPALTPADRPARIYLIALVTAATLVLLQAFRVFVPYLVFDIDQSERTTLATIAVVVFGLTFLGALLFRLFGARGTLSIAAVVLVLGRLGIQFTDTAETRWMLGAATVIGCFWLLIVILPQGRPDVPIGVGFAILLDLMMRALRGTLDLPWMPGATEHVATIVIVAVAAFSAYRVAASGRLGDLESPLAYSAHYVGLGSGVALWLVAAGNLGFAEVRADLGLSGAFALLAVGGFLAVWVEVAAPTGWAGSDNRLTAAALGILGALSIAAWTSGETRWLELAMTPVFAFVVVTLTMRSAMASERSTIPGRWRCGAALTVGLLLQTAFIFLYFARTGPMSLLLVPLVILTLSCLFGEHEAALRLPERRVLSRVVAGGAIGAVAIALVVAGSTDSMSNASPESGLRIMTFNIQEGFAKDKSWSLEETAKTIEEQNPDIVVLQEMTRGWLVMSSVDEVLWLSDRLEMDYAYGGNSYDGLWGNAILSRIPIVSSDEVVFSTTQNLRRGAVAIEVETTNGNLLVIDTHLDNPREEVEVRLEQIEELLAFWDGATPAVIAGDFNADPGSPEWQAMIDAGFVDAAGDDPTTTSDDERRIDYVFVMPDLAVTDYAVPDVWTSDHRPVVVDLSTTQSP